MKPEQSAPSTTKPCDVTLLKTVKCSSNTTYYLTTSKVIQLVIKHHDINITRGMAF